MTRPDRPSSSPRPRSALLLLLLAGALTLVGGSAAAQLAPARPTDDRGYRVWPANVIGDDDRRAAQSTDADLAQAVGTVSCERTDEAGRHFSRATATLVGSRSVVLTAAHAFRSGEGRAASAIDFDAVADCRFSRYTDVGELVAETGFIAVAYGAYRHNLGLPTEDWAVLRTREPLPEPSRPLRFAGLALDELADAGRLPVVALAFHADQRNRRRVPLLSVGELFAIDYAGFRRLAHTADMGRMASGAAIVHRTPDGQSVVLGLHRSAANFGDYNLAVPIAGELEITLNGLVEAQPRDKQLLAIARP
jgi:hypothetical protein